MTACSPEKLIADYLNWYRTNHDDYWWAWVEKALDELLNQYGLGYASL